MSKEKEKRCYGCGAWVKVLDGATHPYIGASPGCWHDYGLVLAKEYEAKKYFENHRLTVDAYAIQHPGVPERRSIQSVNVHLISLALIFEHHCALDDATKRMGQMIEKYQNQFEWLEPPTFQYQITVQDVLKCKAPEDHCQKVREWALHTWSAWDVHHPKIRKYL